MGPMLLLAVLGLIVVVGVAVVVIRLLSSSGGSGADADPSRHKRRDAGAHGFDDGGISPDALRRSGRPTANAAPRPGQPTPPANPQPGPLATPGAPAGPAPTHQASGGADGLMQGMLIGSLLNQAQARPNRPGDSGGSTGGDPGPASPDTTDPDAATPRGGFWSWLTGGSDPERHGVDHDAGAWDSSDSSDSSDSGGGDSGGGDGGGGGD